MKVSTAFFRDLRNPERLPFGSETPDGQFCQYAEDLHPLFISRTGMARLREKRKASDDESPVNLGPSPAVAECPERDRK